MRWDGWDGDGTDGRWLSAVGREILYFRYLLSRAVVTFLPRKEEVHSIFDTASPRARYALRFALLRPSISSAGSSFVAHAHMHTGTSVPPGTVLVDYPRITVPGTVHTNFCERAYKTIADVAMRRIAKSGTQSLGYELSTSTKWGKF